MTIEEILNTLSAEERHMVRLRFGVGDRQNLTTSAIAAAFGTSEVSARQTINAAVKKLRNLADKDPTLRVAFHRAKIPLTGEIA